MRDLNAHDGPHADLIAVIVYSQCLPGAAASSRTTSIVTPPSTTPPKTLPPGYTTTVIYPTASSFTTVYNGHTETVIVDPWPTTPVTLTIPIPTSSTPGGIPPGYTTTVIYPSPSYFTTVFNGQTVTGVVDPWPTTPVTLTIPIATDSATP